MIRIIKTYDECRDFAFGFNDDPNFSDPMLCHEEQLQNNLVKSIEKPDRHCVLGIYREERMIGLFAFLVLRDEQYIEMLVGLSREKEAYLEMFHYLKHHFPGYSADFVFNPGNFILKELLELYNADFEPEHQKMVLGTPVLGLDTTGVELLSEKYKEPYCAIHNKDMYWTGEKVAQTQDRFRTLLAIQDGKVVGYMDVTYIERERKGMMEELYEKNNPICTSYYLYGWNCRAEYHTKNLFSTLVCMGNSAMGRRPCYEQGEMLGLLFRSCPCDPLNVYEYTIHGTGNQHRVPIRNYYGSLYACLRFWCVEKKP